MHTIFMHLPRTHHLGHMPNIHPLQPSKPVSLFPLITRSPSPTWRQLALLLLHVSVTLVVPHPHIDPIFCRHRYWLTNEDK